jgi:DNA-binding NarL/FixJ family response regulator
LLRAVLRPEPDVQAGAGSPSTLTAVELDLLRLVADGLTNRLIAARLGWSEATVKKYVQRVLDKLEVGDRTRAAVEAMRRGLLT